MKSSLITHPGSPALAALLVLAPAWAFARPILEDIPLNTAGRKSTLLQTPAAITVFAVAQRERLGIEGGLDLAAHTPSLSITPLELSLRGVGQSAGTPGSDPGVGVYLDGVYSTDKGILDDARFLDMERIEVLRGPQGTANGHHNVGGAINLNSLQPGPVWRGRVVAELANYDGTLVQGLASGPITDHTSILAAISSSRRDGFQENLYNGGRYEQDDSLYGTFSIRHLTTDHWASSLKLGVVQRDFRPSAGYTLEPYSRQYVQQVPDLDTGQVLNYPGMFAGNNIANPHQGLARENPALRDVSRVSRDVGPSHTSDRHWLSFISQYFRDSYSIKYIGGWSEQRSNVSADADGTAAVDSGLDWQALLFFGEPVSSLTGYQLTPSQVTSREKREVSTVSHELQYLSAWSGRINLVAGFYYYRSQEDQLASYREHNDELMATYAFFAALDDKPVSSSNDLYRTESDLVTRSTALYSQLQWDWSESTTLTFGMRYSHDEKDGGDNTFAQYVGDPDNATVVRQRRDSWSEPTWRLGIDHLFADRHLLYGVVASGYRAGGFNLQKPVSNPHVETVDPEYLLSYELGYKGRLWRDRLDLAVAAYYYDIRDMQVLMPDVIEGVDLHTYHNADDASALGLEVEVRALLSTNLLAGATWSFNDTQYGDLSAVDASACALGPLASGNSQASLCQAEQRLGGNEFTRSPRHKLAVNLTYQWQLAGMAWSATGAYLYTGEQWMSAFNDEQYDRVDSRQRWDARLSARSPVGAWEATAFIKNIADDRDVVLRGRPATATRVASADLAPPRVYGLRLDYRF